MCRKNNIHTDSLTRTRYRGNALIIALFIIVVMSLLGTALVRMISTSSQTVVYEVMGTRAFQAAQSGMQWQLQQIFPLNSAALNCPAIAPPVIANTDGLEGCEILQLTCDDSLIVEGKVYFQLTSTGQCTAGEVVTSRTVEVLARQL